MRPEQRTARSPFRLLAAAILLCFFASTAFASDSNVKVEALLIWGTNDSKSPNPKHKPVEEPVLKKLKELPLKWNHFFEENRKVLEIPSGEARKERLSDKCTVEVKNLGQANMEISLFGRGEPVVKRTQEFPRNEMLVLGGNAPNATAWLVVLKRVD